MRYSLKHLYLKFSQKQPAVLPTVAQTILSDVSLDIKEDDCIGLIGNSGSGKSQLIYALARLNTYYGGFISCDSQTFEHESKFLNLQNQPDLSSFRTSDIGYIFQEAISYFNPVHRLKDQINADLDSSGRINFYEILKNMGIEGPENMLSRYPHQLSGGQLQRVAIAQCLIRRPSIIIADEIDSALDAHTAELVLNVILSSKARYKFALIWISHDVAQALSFCKTIWCMEAGRLIFNGPAIDFKIDLGAFPSVEPIGSEVKIIQAIQVTKTFTKGALFKKRMPNSPPILNRVNLDIFRGEIVGLLGKSGSGKSTLARILAGLESCDEGTFVFNGEQLPMLKPSKNIIYVFQDAYSSLNPKWTSEDILMEAMQLGGEKRSIEIMLQLAGLDHDILKKFPSDLSGGMRQRLALIRALACNPQLLIMDESLNALDHTLQIEMINLLIEHQSRSGMAILLISHQADLVIGLCHRTYVLKDGKLEVN